MSRDTANADLVLREILLAIENFLGLPLWIYSTLKLDYFIIWLSSNVNLRTLSWGLITTLSIPMLESKDSHWMGNATNFTIQLGLASIHQVQI